MNTLFNRLAIAVFSGIPALAGAHPGHGVVEGWAHWFGPEHVLPALIGVGVLLVIFSRKKDRE